MLAAQTADRFGVVAEARHLLQGVGAGDGLVIRAPPEWLDRLLGVLLDNACKYSPEGGRSSVSVVPERTRISLVVDDNGPGIPDDERARIFDRFHRARTSGGPASAWRSPTRSSGRTNGRWRVETSALGGARMAVSWPRAHRAAPEIRRRQDPAVKL